MSNWTCSNKSPVYPSNPLKSQPLGPLLIFKNSANKKNKEQMARSWVPNPAAKVGTLHAEHNIPWMLGFSHSISKSDLTKESQIHRQKKQQQNKRNLLGKKKQSGVGPRHLHVFVPSSPSRLLRFLCLCFQQSSSEVRKASPECWDWSCPPGASAGNPRHDNDLEKMSCLKSHTSSGEKKNIFYVLFVGASQANQRFLKWNQVLFARLAWVYIPPSANPTTLRITKLPTYGAPKRESCAAGNPANRVISSPSHHAAFSMGFWPYLYTILYVYISYRYV